MGYGNPAVLWSERLAVDGGFKIKPAPLDHGIGRAECRGRMDRGQQTGAVIERVRHHRGVVDGGKWEDFAQLADASLLGRARLNEVHRLLSQQTFEITQ